MCARQTLARSAMVFVLTSSAAFAQGLAVTPSQMGLAAPAGSALPATQTATVSSTGPSIAFTAGVRYLGPTTSWLSVAPTTGTTPARVTISASASRLPAGTYQAQVTFDTGRAGAVINVLFSVGSATGTGSYVTDPMSMTFVGDGTSGTVLTQNLAVAVARGSSASSQFLAYGNSDTGWLIVPPFQSSAPATLTVTVAQAGLTPGVRTGTITLAPASGGPPTLVPVTLLISGTAQVVDALKLSQTAVTFNHQSGAVAPPQQTVRVDTITGASQLYDATTSTPWLRLATALDPGGALRASDYTPSDLSLLVDPAGLGGGSYSGSVTISSQGLPTREIPVTLNVVASPVLNARPSSIDLTASADVPVILTLTGATTGFSFTTSVTAGAASWLSVTPASGSTTTASTSITVSVRTGALTPGTYNGAVTVAVQGGPTFSIPVRLSLENSGAPIADALQFVPNSLDLTAIAGNSAPVTQTIDVLSSVYGPAHSFTADASSDGGWLSVQPFSGTAPGRITVTANPAAVAGPGSYDGTITITSLITAEQQQIPVTFTVAAEAITADPPSVEFIQSQRGAPVNPQTVRLESNSPGAFSVTASADWIRVNPATGFTPGALNVWADVASLPPGSNSGTIRVTSGTKQVSIPVSVTIVGPASPTAQPSSLTITYQTGAPAPSQSIAVGTTGEPITFTASATTESGTNWLSVTPASGSTPGAITVTVNPAQLVPGRQAGTITLASTDPVAAPISIPVTVTVTASPTVVQTLLHAATFAPTPIAPGLLISITGTGLGPAAGISARPTAAGTFDTTLGGTRVLFEGVPAPILFARADQVNAIVPYSVYGRATSHVQVESSGANLSVAIELRVVDAAPGLFTASPTGRGQAAALNVDFTSNSATNPADRGSVISLFGTGEGQTDPPGQDGRIITSDLRRPLMPMTATIGGRPAQVTYSGSASYMVSGVFQVNLRIPPDVEPGTVPVIIQVGNTSTQSGVTISVR